MPFLPAKRAAQLLREDWTSLPAFARQLVNLLTARDAIEIEDEVTIKAQPGKPALRLVEGGRPPIELALGSVEKGASAAPSAASQARRAAAVEEARRAFVADPSAGPAPSIPPPSAGRARSPFAAGPAFESPVLEVEGRAAFRAGPVQFDFPPQVRNPQTGVFEPIDLSPAEPEDRPPPPARTCFLGRVVEKSDDDPRTYVVDILGDGSRADPTDRVSVYCPQIDPEETIPEDAILPAVHLLPDGTYEAQPFVWYYDPPEE